MVIPRRNLCAMLGMGLPVEQVFFLISKAGLKASKPISPLYHLIPWQLLALPDTASFPLPLSPLLFSRAVSVHGELFLFFSYINAMK